MITRARAQTRTIVVSNGDGLGLRRIFTEEDRTFFLPMRLRLGQANLTRVYKQHSWSRAAIAVKAQTFSSVPLIVLRGDQRGDEDSGQPVGSDDPLQAVVDRPNPMMTGAELLEGTSINLDLFGEALWLMVNRPDGGFDPASPPKQVWLLPMPQTWERDVAGGVIVGWKRTNAGKTDAYTGGQVLHFKLFNEADQYRGLAPAEAVRLSVSNDFTAGRLNEALMENGADPGGVIITDGDLKLDQRDDLRQEWERRHRGALNRGRVAVLSGGIKYVPTAISHREMQFLETREWSREEVLAVYQVPKLVVGLIEDVNRSTARETMRVFWQQAIIPRQSLVEAVLWHGLFAAVSAGQRQATWARFDRAGVEALQAEFGETLDQAMKLKGLDYPLNAINDRLGLGMDDVTWGAAPLANPNQVPINLLHEQPGAFVPSAAAPEEAAVSPSSNGQQHHRGPPVPFSVVEYEREFFHPAERKVLVGLRDYLRAARDAQLDRLQEWASKRAAPPISAREVDEFLLRVSNWDRLMKSRIGRPIRDVMAAALRRLGGELGGFSVISDDLAQPWVKQHGLRRVASMVRISARDRLLLRRAIVSAMGKEGVSNVAGIREAIRKFFKGQSAGRAQVIARTETGILSSGVRFEGMKRDGVKKHEWITAQDEAVRPAEPGPRPGQGNHRDVHGQVVTIGKTFKNGLRYPLDPNGPPAEVIACRCAAVAVVE